MKILYDVFFLCKHLTLSEGRNNIRSCLCWFNLFKAKLSGDTEREKNVKRLWLTFEVVTESPLT